MARRGLLPHILAYVSPRFETPVAAIIAYGTIVALLALSGSFTVLATLLVTTEQIMFSSSILALIVMWWRNDAGLRESMSAKWIGIIAVAILWVLFLLRQVPLDAAVTTAGFVAAGFALYFISKRGAVAQDGIELPEEREAA